MCCQMTRLRRTADIRRATQTDRNQSGAGIPEGLQCSGSGLSLAEARLPGLADSGSLAMCACSRSRWDGLPPTLMVLIVAKPARARNASCRLIHGAALPPASSAVTSSPQSSMILRRSSKCSLRA